MNNNKEISEDTKQLIINYLQGVSTIAEKHRIDLWLNESESNREYFNTMKSVWILIDKTANPARFNENSLWNSLKSKINQPIKKKLIFDFRIVNYKQIAKIAASGLIVFLFGSSLSYWLVRHNSGISHQLTSINTPLGSRSHILLPDGSSVWLNAGSALEYSNAFNDNTREIKLTGEAYFNVTSNKSKPFIVNAQNIIIKAYGTSFNVKAYSEEEKVITTLVEGNVKIEGEDQNRKPFSITMEPKQKVTCFVSEKSLNVAKTEANELQNNAKRDLSYSAASSAEIPASRIVNVKTELFTSWKDKRWIVEGEKFKDLAMMLGRRYNVSINLSSEDLNNYRFSGTIENETLEQVFEILRLTLPIEYLIEKGEVYVKTDKKLKEKYKMAY